jgi:hypothetical protein
VQGAAGVSGGEGVGVSVDDAVFEVDEAQPVLGADELSEGDRLRSGNVLRATLGPQAVRWGDGGSPMDGQRQGRSSGPERVYLDVPFAEKDDAKAAGARWDPRARRWYDPHPPTSALHRWAAPPEVPEVLPGEDRSFGAGLFVDLVPSSCWFTNVRSCVSQQDWDRLRRPILRRADYRCEICGAPEDRTRQQWLDVHERCHYNDRTGVQTLRRLLAVCKACHLATHFGYARVSGRDEEARTQLTAVSGLTRIQVAEHIDEAFEL